MISLVKILNEMSKYEMVSKGLRQLYEKYKDHPELDKLYVNFSDYASDPIIKAPVLTPDHKDPVGVYAYPLDFVLGFIDGIPYAGDRKYIRVIKDKSKNKVVLSDITHKNFNSVYRPLLRKGGLSDEEITVILQRNPGKRIFGENPESRWFFQCIQYDVEKRKVRTPLEQTRLLLKMGLDALEDKSTERESAIVNGNEPSQIIFLKRTAFEVAEVIEQKGGAYFYGRVAGGVAREVDSKIVKSPYDSYFILSNGIELKFFPTNIIVGKDILRSTRLDFKDYGDINELIAAVVKAISELKKSSSDVAHVDGDLDLTDYQRPLPLSLKSVGGSLYLGDYPHPLPSSLQSIGGGLDLRDYQHPLPSSLQSIGGSLDLRGYQHPLPSSLQSIGGSLDLGGYQHPLPSSLKSVGGTIFLDTEEQKRLLPKGLRRIALDR